MHFYEMYEHSTTDWELPFIRDERMFCPSSCRPVPSGFIREGIFSAGKSLNGSIEFDDFTVSLLETDQDTSLDMIDLRVLAEILFLCQQSKLDQVVEVSARDLVKNVGYSIAGSAYERVEESLIRLTSAVFVAKPFDESIQESRFTLLDFLDTGKVFSSTTELYNEKKEFLYQYNKRSKTWFVKPSRLLYAIANQARTTFVPLKTLHSLSRSQLEQWLVLFYSTHDNSKSNHYSYKVETLLQKSGLLVLPDSMNLFEFRRTYMLMKKQGSQLLSRLPHIFQRISSLQIFSTFEFKADDKPKFNSKVVVTA